MSLAPSSPRLPSPPPPAENQIGSQSPSGGATASLESIQTEQTMLDANSRRRIHPGTKAVEMASGPPLVALNELDSAFQLQEHLAALHCYHTTSNTQPLTRAAALQLAQPPPGIDRTLWLYELCRFLISQCNSLIVGFLFDDPPCSASTCPEMRASEWQFLCAVHEQPKSCCAIDYCCHTLDWAANVVTDQKIFPSRFVVLSDPNSKNVGVKNLVNVFRRLHRIFAHAWFQHRGVFWSVEGQTGLYVFFKSVCDSYDLLPAENYKLPPEAEGLEAPPAEQEPEKSTPQILKSTSHQRGSISEDDNFQPVRTNTRRHIRSNPSVGSAVTTVMETDEEDTDSVARRMKKMHLAAPSPVSEEFETADIPVIVEQHVLSQDMSDKPELSPSALEHADADEAVPPSEDEQTVVDESTMQADGDEADKNEESVEPGKTNGSGVAEMPNEESSKNHNGSQQHEPDSESQMFENDAPVPEATAEAEAEAATEGPDKPAEDLKADK